MDLKGEESIPRGMSHNEELCERLRDTPVSTPPRPRKLSTNAAVGGLTEIGFLSSTDYLLVVSSSGRGLFDCVSGEKLCRDPTPQHKGDWYAPQELLAEGIGPASGRLIAIAGLHGGGLPTTTVDGWSLTRVAPDWPLESIFLEPPGKDVMYERHTAACAKIAQDYESRAFGFSPTGKCFVIACSHGIFVYTRP